MIATEADLQDVVMDAARLAGWLVFHDHDSRRNPAGLPDLVLVKPPRVVFLELKTATGRVRAEQQTWLDALAGCDTVASALVRPDDIPTVLDYLERN
jgi:hypothetical protein